MDYRRPRILICHEPMFGDQAREFAEKFSCLGAKVTIQEQQSLRHFRRRICYFEESHRAKKIAESLADNIRSVQKLAPYIVNIPDPRADFIIYFATRGSAKAAPPPRPKVIHVPDGYRQCDHCISIIRLNRYPRHLRRAHKLKDPSDRRSKRKTPIKRPSKATKIGVRDPIKKRRLVYVQSPPDFATPQYRAPGAPGRLGWSGTNIKQLRPKSKTRLCRGCIQRPPIYADGECYACHSK